MAALHLNTRPGQASAPAPRRIRRLTYGLLGLAAAAGVGFASFSKLRAQQGPDPIVIRKGGVYTGTYRSTDSGTPCVTIATTAPVTLRNCTLSGAGNLIEANIGNAQLTVINCRGYGLVPSQDQTARGHFVVASGAKSVRIEHNYLEQTAGINIYQWNGDGSAGQTLTVRYNQARNIDSRYRNGGHTLSNFVGLNAVRVLANLEIAWNQVVNEPNNSLVEDNIAIYNSGGTARSPFRVHDNYVQGAYPYPAASEKYSGTGLIVDGDKDSSQGYIEAYNNQFVSTCNSAMNIASGHHVRYHHNRIVTSGLLPDGLPLGSAYTGIAVFNCCHQAAFGHHQVDHNTIGYVQWGRSSPYPNRQDEADYGLRIHANTEHLSNPVTLRTELAEWERWQQKLRKQALMVGPVLPQATRGPRPVASTH
jgi:hypothetical protein